METLRLEVMAEEHRQQLIRTMNRIRLEREVQQNSLLPGWFARGMIFVGAGLIELGGRLQQRYTDTRPVQRSFSMSQH